MPGCKAAEVGMQSLLSLEQPAALARSDEGPASAMHSIAGTCQKCVFQSMIQSVVRAQAQETTAMQSHASGAVWHLCAVNKTCIMKALVSGRHSM